MTAFASRPRAYAQHAFSARLCRPAQHSFLVRVCKHTHHPALSGVVVRDWAVAVIDGFQNLTKPNIKTSSSRSDAQWMGVTDIRDREGGERIGVQVLRERHSQGYVVAGDDNPHSRLSFGCFAASMPGIVAGLGIAVTARSSPARVGGLVPAEERNQTVALI